VFYHPTQQWIWLAVNPLSLTQQFDPAHSAIGRVVPQGAFTLTQHGTLTSSTRGEQWFRNLAPLLLDTEAIVYDSNGLPRHSPLARIKFTSAATLQDVYVEHVLDDAANWDNESQGALLVDGSALDPYETGSSSFPPDFLYDWTGRPRGWWATTRSAVNVAPSTHVIEIVAPPQIGRPGTFGRWGGNIKSIIAGIGQSFTSQASVSKRLVLISDDIMIGQDVGSPASPAVNGCKTLLAADFPTTGTGSVIAMCGATRALWDMYTAPGGLAAFAQLIAETCQLGGATTIYPLISLGFRDYAHAITDGVGPWTPARFGAAMQALVTALGALLPGVTIYASLIPQAQYNSIANSLGYTVTQYNSQISALTGCTVVNINSPTPIAWLGSSPSSIPSATGTATLKANIKSLLGY
jgi:hypothetical protein